MKKKPNLIPIVKVSGPKKYKKYYKIVEKILNSSPYREELIAAASTALLKAQSNEVFVGVPPYTISDLKHFQLAKRVQKL